MAAEEELRRLQVAEVEVLRRQARQMAAAEEALRRHLLQALLRPQLCRRQSSAEARRRQAAAEARRRQAAAKALLLRHRQAWKIAVLLLLLVVLLHHLPHILQMRISILPNVEQPDFFSPHPPHPLLLLRLLLLRLLQLLLRLSLLLRLRLRLSLRLPRFAEPAQSLIADHDISITELDG